jgi:hypothetical protein
MSRDPSQQVVITGTTPLFLIFVLPITLFHTAGWTRISVGLPTFPKVVRVNQRSESSIGSAGKYRGGWIKQHGKYSINLLGDMRIVIIQQRHILNKILARLVIISDSVERASDLN